MELDENSPTRLTSVAVDLNAVAFTALYTVPPGKIFSPDYVKPEDLSGDAGNTVVTLGQSGDKDDFVGARTLSNLDAAGKSCKLEPINNTTPPAIMEYTAGEVFGIDVTTAAGAACTCNAAVFGTLRNA